MTQEVAQPKEHEKEFDLYPSREEMRLHVSAQIQSLMRSSARRGLGIQDPRTGLSDDIVLERLHGWLQNLCGDVPPPMAYSSINLRMLGGAVSDLVLLGHE